LEHYEYKRSVADHHRVGPFINLKSFKPSSWLFPRAVTAKNEDDVIGAEQPRLCASARVITRIFMLATP
jgi:hypothetical protein